MVESQGGELGLRVELGLSQIGQAALGQLDGEAGLLSGGRRQAQAGLLGGVLQSEERVAGGEGIGLGQEEHTPEHQEDAQGDEEQGRDKFFHTDHPTFLGQPGVR